MQKIDPTKAIEIRPGVWWLGWPDYDAGFSNNPYLILEGEEAILIDPGSRLEEHWSWVRKKIESVIPIEKITTVIVHHQDPDLCAAIPLIEEIVGVDNFDIITSERTALFIPYYGVRTQVTAITDGDRLEIGENGRYLQFITTPYLHFPGAFVTYDSKEKILFSSDIFAGFSVNWSLFADEYYVEAIKTFSQPYFPAKRHVLNFLNKIANLEIDLICPQHGSIIPKEKIPAAIETLRNLEVGIWK